MHLYIYSIREKDGDYFNSLANSLSCVCEACECEVNDKLSVSFVPVTCTILDLHTCTQKPKAPDIALFPFFSKSEEREVEKERQYMYKSYDLKQCRFVRLTNVLEVLYRILLICAFHLFLIIFIPCLLSNFAANRMNLSRSLSLFLALCSRPCVFLSERYFSFIFFSTCELRYSRRFPISTISRVMIIISINIPSAFFLYLSFATLAIAHVINYAKFSRRMRARSKQTDIEQIYGRKLFSFPFFIRTRTTRDTKLTRLLC